ncbi:MAG: RNA 2',3'-cyclic phosphodiesterase [Planctomycetia bacterium]|nr:RNA 2',3'-cyclic phosphodiesterase [Planctomycetia bacterium]
MSVLRTFIAVDAAPTPALRRLHDRLSELGDRFRPVSLANLHITLRFLGDTAPSQLAPIGELVRQAVELRDAFHVRLKGLGAFPHARRPSVVWLGLDQAEPLCQIAADLDRVLSTLGFLPEQRPFTPHLTLLRIKSRPPESLHSLLEKEADTDFGMIEVNRVHFYQSELGRNGSKYTRLSTATLRGG